MFGRICCLHFGIQSVKCFEKDSTAAGHGGQKPVGDGGSTKGQFVNRKLRTNNEEAEVSKKFSGQNCKEKFREGSVNEKTGYCMCFQEGYGVKRCRQRYLVGLSSSYLAHSVS